MSVGAAVEPVPARPRERDARGWLYALALPAVIALAAANFLWQLGSSSYYVDELLSVNAAVQPLGSVLNTVGRTEITPPAYFFFLHEWIGRLGGSRAEWVTRLPSALCGVLLVGAVYWLASLLSERPAFALFAAALCAFSPFVLEYAQRAQGYAFVALAVTAAVAAAIQHDRADRRRALWLGASLAASVLSLCLNYTAALVVAPLCAWVATRAAVSGRWRWGFAGACATVEVALVPLLLTQHDAFPNRSGVASIAGLTPTTLANMLEVPFGGRVNALRPLGIAVTVGALLALLGSRRFREQRFGAGRLLVLIAVGEPLSLVVLSAFGGHAFFGHLMLTRYAAVAAPFIIVAIALALEAIPWPLAGLLAAGAAVVTIAGGIDNHRPQAFYLDARDVVAYVQAHVRPGDAVLAPPYPWDALPLTYYGLARLRPWWTGNAKTAALVRARTHRLWVISELPPGDVPTAGALLAYERRVLEPLDYAAITARVFPAVEPLAVVLEAPPRRPLSRIPSRSARRSLATRARGVPRSSPA